MNKTFNPLSFALAGFAILHTTFILLGLPHSANAQLPTDTTDIEELEIDEQPPSISIPEVFPTNEVQEEDERIETVDQEESDLDESDRSFQQREDQDQQQLEQQEDDDLDQVPPPTNTPEQDDPDQIEIPL